MNNNYYLPLEICNKILLYNIHPVAEIIKKHNDPMTKFVKILKYLKKGHEKMCEVFLNDYNDFPEDQSDFCSFYVFYMLSELNPWAHHNQF